MDDKSYEILMRIDSKVSGIEAKMNTEFSYIKDTQKDHEERICEIEKKPARRWDTVVTNFIVGIVAALIGSLSNLFKH